MIYFLYIRQVKSKFKALQQKNSGLESHLAGMEDYIRIYTKTGKIMDDRKREACRILDQYHELELYNVDREFKNEEEFLKLDIEIIFVFSFDTRDIHRKIHRNQKVNEI